MNLLGNKSYKKYVSIVSGMILVLIVIQPLMKLMKIDENLDYFLKANEFAVETSDFKSDLSRMEEQQTKAIFAEYEEKIRIQVIGILKEEEVELDRFDIIIEKDPKSIAFGEIKSLMITAHMENKNEDKKEGRLPIDVIAIDPITVDGKEEKATQSPPSPIEINIKNKLSDFYNIEQSNINISIQGG
jgi:stage III sporulation protein AF